MFMVSFFILIWQMYEVFKYSHLRNGVSAALMGIPNTTQRLTGSGLYVIVVVVL